MVAQHHGGVRASVRPDRWWPEPHEPSPRLLHLLSSYCGGQALVPAAAAGGADTGGGWGAGCWAAGACAAASCAGSVGTASRCAAWCCTAIRAGPAASPPGRASGSGAAAAAGGPRDPEAPVQAANSAEPMRISCCGAGSGRQLRGRPCPRAGMPVVPPRVPCAAAAAAASAAPAGALTACQSKQRTGMMLLTRESHESRDPAVWRVQRGWA